MATLESLGYEPVRRGGEVRLRNCPFHALTERHRTLVCGTNLALLEGVLSTAQRPTGRQRLTAALDPRPGMCCVVLRTSTTRRRTATP
jgi:predicted ArsR family transcriptional regulator